MRNTRRTKTEECPAAGPTDMLCRGHYCNFIVPYLGFLKSRQTAFPFIHDLKLSSELLICHLVTTVHNPFLQFNIEVR